MKSKERDELGQQVEWQHANRFVRLSVAGNICRAAKESWQRTLGRPFSPTDHHAEEDTFNVARAAASVLICNVSFLWLMQLVKQPCSVEIIESYIY